MKVGLMQNVNKIKALSNKWEILNFKQVLKDSSGGNIKIKTKDTLNEGVLPVVDQGKDFVCGYTNNVLAKVKANLPLIVFGDHTRNLKYIDFDFAMGADGTKILEVINSDALPRFIYYYLTSIEIVNTGYNRHFKFIKDLVFPLPPLSTQKRIAEILDNAAALRDKTQQLLTEYDQLAQSIFLDMFGDPVTNPKKLKKEKLGNHITLINGRAYKRDELLKDGTPVLRIQNLNGGERWFYSNLDLPSNKYCHYGDLLFAWSASFGPYLYSGKKAIFHYHIWNCKLKKTMDKFFAFNLLLRLTKSIKSASHGASMLHITKGKMENWDIIVPPIEIQNQFAEKIALIEQQKDLAKQELQESEDLFQALLQKAFKGELVY